MRDCVAEWLVEAEARYLADLTFSEAARALRALSSSYVERRGSDAVGRALEGRGKRTAFALYYAPLHFLLMRAVVAQLDAAQRPPRRVIDLGCGTGVASAAWALACDPPPRLEGVDRHPWAIRETRWTWRTLGLRGRTRRMDLGRMHERLAAWRGGADKRAGASTGIVAAYVVNELKQHARETLLNELLAIHRRGASVLVVEPLARGVTPWWDTWRRAFEAAAGRADEWRVAAARPPIVARLDRAAGLDHRELTARSLWLSTK